MPKIPKADIDFIGRIFASNQYGSFKVLGRTGERKGTNATYEVEFLITGYQTEACKNKILKGKLRDPFFPFFRNVGYIGNASTMTEDGKRKSSYTRWMHMIDRCFNEECSQYGSYGTRGITVCDRWKSFENYDKDLLDLPNYGKLKHDTVDRINNEGDYEPSNCRWASRHMQADNTSLLSAFVACCPGGLLSSNNQKSFARQHDLYSTGISRCISSKQKTHKGWRFKKMNIVRNSQAIKLWKSFKSANIADL